MNGDNVIDRDSQIWFIAYWYYHEAHDMNRPEAETIELWKINAQVMAEVLEKLEEIKHWKEETQ